MITRVALILFVISCLTSCTGFDPQAYVPGLETPTSSFTSVPESPSPVFPSASSTIMVPAPTKVVVCTNIPNGKLHVRFAPGDQSDVRGYLTDGESVTLSGEQKEIERALWVKLSRPIEGWVNATYLCEAKQ